MIETVHFTKISKRFSLQEGKKTKQINVGWFVLFLETITQYLSENRRSQHETIFRENNAPKQDIFISK